MTGGSTITIAGLGPGDPAQRTLEARKCLDEASMIILRTGVHPGVEDLTADPRTEMCDDIYDNGSTFDQVYVDIAERVLERAKTRDVVFAVPGHPTFGERSTAIIRAEAASRGIGIRLISGISAVDAVAAALGVDPLAEQAQCIDALELVHLGESEPYAGGRLTVDPYRPVFVSQIYAPRVASAVKLWLAGLFPDDHRVLVIRAAGVEGEESIADCQVSELDRLAVDHLASAWIPALPPLAASRHWGTLVSLVARLRAPGGCPWDQVQTHHSLRDAVIDEAYEAVDAIDAGDVDNLAEELGDLLLVVTMHAQIAEEAGHFSINDSLEFITTKLIRRHPHVFGELQLDSPADVLQNWQNIKAVERAERGEPARSTDPLERLPRSMPALTKAVKILKKHGWRKGNQIQSPDAGDRLLAVVAEITTSGDDPEAMLHAALRRYVQATGLLEERGQPVTAEATRSMS
ncbi:MAG TPA: MazG family protein [Thermomicrobiales bacterium]|nr:MazG family protein [Thermomicrobiales bacterium]